MSGSQARIGSVSLCFTRDILQSTVKTPDGRRGSRLNASSVIYGEQNPVDDDAPPTAQNVRATVRRAASCGKKTAALILGLGLREGHSRLLTQELFLVVCYSPLIEGNSSQ